MAEPLPLLGSGDPAAGVPMAGALPPPAPELFPEPLLCHHCGRTASNGVSCEGMCVADSGY